MQVWDRIAPRYDKFIRMFVAEHYSVIVDWIWERLEEDHEVLEIGGGTGNVSLEAARKVKHIVINDISPQMLEIAAAKAHRRNRENVSFVMSDAANLPFPAQSFDVCLIINVLHVVADPLACLREALRVLRPQGLLMVSSFCHAEGWKMRLISSLTALLSGIAFRKLNAAEFADMVERSGFYVLEKRRLPSALPLLFLVAAPYQ